VMVTTPRFIANRDAYADPWKRGKMERLTMLLRGAINAASRVGLMMNVRRADLDAVVKILPALATPTISALADDRWVAVNTVVEERLVRELIPKLSEAGARGLVEYPLNKIVD
jgi:ATP phosphoribosyltransferase